ncbi:substrate-binding domain-containing protein [uncultured Mesotoga sp.]|uniref:substrate-binding domain-containing protein n=1 Tax=uncultured Mesotoga sp. TaxID=1184400 RepID=UPI00259531A8|nr:substrate-binding domain-containing protein [uncultured Mesotoga sp.]
MKKVLTVAVLVSVLILSSLGFASLEKPVMGISLISYYNPFFLALRDGAKEALDEIGGVLLESDSQQDVAKQMAAVESFISRKVDVILLNAVDSEGVIPAVEAANKAGIPVITVDNDASGGDVKALVASDNILAGKLCAEYVVARLVEEKGVAAGNVVILDALPVTGVLHRLQGFYSVIQAYPQIRIISTQNAQGNRTDGFTVMENILLGQSEIDVVFAINDPSALGAMEAIMAAGRAEEMFIVSVDGAKEAMEAIKGDTPFAMTAAQLPTEIGKIGVEVAMKVLRGEEVERFIPVPVYTVSQENVDEFLEKATF